MSTLTSVQTRAQDADLVNQCRFAKPSAEPALSLPQGSGQVLQNRLPLLWPTPPDTAPSPKKQYRSHYRYRGCEKLTNLAAWAYLPSFEIALHLIDFSGLRPVLAQQLGWQTARGQIPFDPVSMFLLHGWQVTNKWNRAEMLKNLRDPRYADLAAIFGFENGVYPTEGGLRYFLTTLGQNSPDDDNAVVVDEETGEMMARQRLNELIAQSVQLLLDAGLLSPESWKEAQICPDGMLHDAASRLRCAHVKAGCYEPTTADEPRACPAQDKGKQGCACDTLACACACHFATPCDAEARFVVYAGRNQPSTSPNKPTDINKQKKSRGRAVYGYRSLPLLLVDRQRRFSIVLVDDFHPANAPEPLPVVAYYKQLSDLYPSLNVDVVSGDAAFGVDAILRVVYRDLHARRVIDLRAHETDKNPLNWVDRGYDDKGCPLCPFGYRLLANGFDAARQRRKYFCNRICTQGAAAVIDLETVPQPPVACPHLSSDSQRGFLINVGERFADGSIRLVRDVRFGSAAWKELYHRPRNASEGRNAVLEKWGMKRLSVFGLPRGRATILLADVWVNLTTLARLIREANLVQMPP
jgi:hypothetical protein